MQRICSRCYPPSDRLDDGGKRVVVCGYGDVGKGTAASFRGAGAIVTVTEIDPMCSSSRYGWFEVKKLISVIRNADIVITATGNKDILKGSDFLAMKDKAIVCNIGHFDNEIDMAWLNENYGANKSEIKPQVDLYTLEEGKRLLFYRGSFGQLRMCHWSS